MNMTKPSNTKIKLFEFFAGIGSTHKALNNLKLNYEVVGISEWFIDAIIAYNAIHFDNDKLNDINEWERKRVLNELYSFQFSNDSKKPISLEKLKDSKLFQLYDSHKRVNNFGSINQIKGNMLGHLDFNVLTYTFPCQDISIQGKQTGLSEDSQSRSSLVWEVLRVLKELKKINKLPKILLMENVKNIFSKIHVQQLAIFESELVNLGYKNSPHYILNSSSFGSPQNRERAFLISVLSKSPISWKNSKEIATLKKHKSLYIKDILDGSLEEIEYLLLKDQQNIDHNKWITTKNQIKKNVINNYTNFQSEKIIYDINFKGPTLTASGANNRLKFFTNNKIQIISPNECIKYMCFDNNDYTNMINASISKQKIRFLAGNSIVVNVLENIFLYIKELLELK